VTEPVRSRGGFSQLLRNYAWIASAELLSKALGFAAFALLARSLAPAAYGSLEVAVAVGMVGLLIVDFGLGPIAARAMTHTPARIDSMTGSVPVIRLVLAGATLAAAIVIAPLLASDKSGQQLIVLFAGALLFAPWILDWVFQGLDRTAWVAPAQLLRMSVFLIGVAAFVRGPADLVRVGWIEIAGFAALALYYVAASRRHGQRPGLRPDGESIRELLRESAPVGAGQFLWILNQYLPTFVLAGALAASEVAFYGAAHRIVFGLGSFVFLYFFTLYPVLVRTTHDEPERFEPLMRGSLRATAWLGGLGAVTGTLAAEPVCRLAFGEAFADAERLLALLVWALPIHLLSGHARFALIAAGHAQAHLRAQAVGVAVTLCGCAVGIPLLGSEGAAIALLGAALAVWAAAHRAVVQRIGPMPGLAAVRRPATAAAASLALGSVLPVPAWAAGAIGAGAFATAGIWSEREALQPLAAWLRTAVDEGPA